jgi:hypothetical protein
MTSAAKKQFLINDDTAASVEINGQRYFGVNSGAQPAEALGLRKQFLGMIQDDLGALSGKTINRTQALLHGESHA